MICQILSLLLIVTLNGKILRLQRSMQPEKILTRYVKVMQVIVSPSHIVITTRFINADIDNVLYSCYLSRIRTPIHLLLAHLLGY